MLGNPYEDSFFIDPNLDGSFNLVIVDPSELAVTTANNNLTFEIEYNHPNALASFIDLKNADLDNVNPSIDSFPAGDIIITNSKSSAPIYSFTGVNGSFTTSLNQLDLVWSLTGSTNTVLFSINQSGVLTANQLNTPEGTYPIEVTLSDGGGGQAVCNFNVIYSYTTTVDFDNNIDSLTMTNQPGGGGNRIETLNGGFTITNSPIGNVPFQIRGNTSGGGGATFSVSYRLQIYDSNSNLVADMQTATNNSTNPNINPSPTLLGNGDYTFIITISSFNYPSTPLTTATATIIQPY